MTLCSELAQDLLSQQKALPFTSWIGKKKGMEQKREYERGDFQHFFHAIPYFLFQAVEKGGETPSPLLYYTAWSIILVVGPATTSLFLYLFPWGQEGPTSRVEPSHGLGQDRPPYTVFAVTMLVIPWKKTSQNSVSSFIFNSTEHLGMIDLEAVEYLNTVFLNHFPIGTHFLE